jgi:hypothetical protein
LNLLTVRLHYSCLVNLDCQTVADTVLCATLTPCIVLALGFARLLRCALILCASLALLLETTNNLIDTWRSSTSYLVRNVATNVACAWLVLSACVVLLSLGETVQ